jgi:hypothetical protein
MKGDDAGRSGPRWGYLPLAGESPTIEMEGDDAGPERPEVGVPPACGGEPDH